MLDAPTTRVAYVEVTPTIFDWIQPTAIKSTLQPRSQIAFAREGERQVRGRGEKSGLGTTLLYVSSEVGVTT